MSRGKSKPAKIEQPAKSTDADAFLIELDGDELPEQPGPMPTLNREQEKTNV